MSENPTVISLFIDSKVWNSFPRDKILIQKDFFLKCDAYDVYLPIISDDENELNIFEETILRLSAINRIDLERIHQQLCLKPDFTRVIWEHLLYKEYIGEDGRISEFGKVYLGKSEQEADQQKKQQKQHYRILVLKQTGEILPHIFRTDYKIKLQASLDKCKMTILYGSRGKPKSIDGFIWTPKKGEYRVRSKIQQSEIIRMVQLHNMQNPLNMLRLSTSDTIDISKKPMEVYLHVKMILQRGLLDAVIVSDGSSFVNGVVTKYAREQQQEDVLRLRKNAEQNIKSNKQTAQNFKKYNEVHSAMELAKIPEGDTIDEIQQRKQIRSDNLIRMHTALEWACAHFLRIYSIDPNSLKSLQVNTCKQNQKILLMMARRMGFSIKEDNEVLLGRLDGLFLRQYQESDVPNLNVLLPLIIVSAKDNPSSSLREVAREMPYIFHTFKRLSETKMLRHGNEQVKDDFNDYKTIELEVKKFLKLLLPGYADEETQSVIVAQDDSSVIRLHAEENVSRFLGRDIYERFGNRLKEDICTLALTADPQNEREAIDFVICLSRV